MFPSCSTGPQSPVPPVCQMQLVPGIEQSQRPHASAVARAAPSKSRIHCRRLDRSVLSKEIKSCYIALHVTLVW